MLLERVWWVCAICKGWVLIREIILLLERVWWVCAIRLGMCSRYWWANKVSQIINFKFNLQLIRVWVQICQIPSSSQSTLFSCCLARLSVPQNDFLFLYLGLGLQIKKRKTLHNSTIFLNMQNLLSTGVCDKSLVEDEFISLWLDKKSPDKKNKRTSGNPALSIRRLGALGYKARKRTS
jgi:hypothetical protein